MILITPLVGVLPYILPTFGGFPYCLELIIIFLGVVLG